MQGEGETQVIKYVKYMVSEDDKPREKKKSRKGGGQGRRLPF